MQLKNVTTKVVNELAQHYEFPAISILMPMHRVSTPPHVQEDSIRLKNNISRVKELLEEADTDLKLAKSICDRIETLHKDHEFLRKQSLGLGLFITKTDITAVSLPYSVENHVVVNERFHISPMITMMQESRDFHILQISDNNPRMLKGNLYEIEELDLDLPKTRKEALNIDEFEQEMQSHTGDGKGRAMYHGHAHDEEHEGAEQKNYYRVLDRLVKPHIEAKTPVILAGTKRDITLYRSVTKLSAIHDDAIEQSTERMSIEDIHDRARAILRTWSTDEAYKIRTKFKQLAAANSDKAIYDLNKIMTAAAEGRIAQLLVKIKRITKDTVQSGVQDQTVIGHEEIDAQPLDEITIGTWSQSGQIYGLDSTLMPTTSPLAAILRY